MEAALTSPEVPLERIPPSTLMFIGIHARDAFGRRASRCQTIEWLLDWIKDFKLMEVRWIDPWDPVVRGQLEKEMDQMLPTVDPMPLVDVALGAALVAMRQAFPMPPEKIDERHDAEAMAAARKGATYGMQLASKLAVSQWEAFAKALR
jgi:hypothetical protein